MAEEKLDPNQPDPLLREFLRDELPLPDVKARSGPYLPDTTKAWEDFNPNLYGDWVPGWFPRRDSEANLLSKERRAQEFHDELLKHLGLSSGSPLSGNDSEKKRAVALALLSMLYEHESVGIHIPSR